MNNPLRVSPSKGNQGTTRGKENVAHSSLIYTYLFIMKLDSTTTV